MARFASRPITVGCADKSKSTVAPSFTGSVKFVKEISPGLLMMPNGELFTSAFSSSTFWTKK